ncbi:MAG: hypothetical protein ACW981_08155 [Candidatus Hodarchaeales archaeon]|jgi:hypothetical protein
MINSNLNIALKDKDLGKWRKCISLDQENINFTIKNLSEALIPYLQSDDSYFEYANVVWDSFTKEEDRQSILWVWIEEIYRLDRHYCNFLINLSWNLGNLDYLEYLFDLLTLFYLPKARENDVSFLGSDFYEKLINHTIPEVFATAQLFSYQEQLIDKISISVLEKLDYLPEKLQEKLLDPIFNSIQDDFLAIWIQENLKNSLTRFTDRIKTGIIIQILNNCLRFQNNLSKVKLIIADSKDVFLRETILLFIIPSEIISQPLLEPILEIYTNKNNLEYNLLLLQHLPQFFDDWTSNLQQKIVNMFEYENPEVRSAILLLLSPTWINEELLIAGLYDKNRKVQDAAVQSAAILFQRIGKNIKNKISTLIQSTDIAKHSAYGFFLGYNFNLKIFHEEIKNILSSEDINEQEKQIQCLRGLILQWSNLPLNIRELITTNSMQFWSETVKKSVHESFTMILGSLDDEGKDLYEYLSKQKNFLSVDLDVIHD